MNNTKTIATAAAPCEWTFRMQHITVLLKPNEIIYMYIFLKRTLLIKVVDIYVTVVHIVQSVMGIYPGNILMGT